MNNNTNVIEEAIANMASTSQALDKFCNDPKNCHTYRADLLQQMSWELYKQADALREYQQSGGS